MKHLLLAASILSLSAGVAQAATPATGTIIVEGHGSVKHAPDYGKISYTLTGEGASEVAALQALASKRAQVEGAIGRLASAKRVKIAPSPLSVEKIECDEENRARCARANGGPLFVASLETNVEVTPAERTGDAASLAAEMGAGKVSVEGGGVLDDDALARSAAKAALANAEMQARTIADAQGLRLGPVLEVSGLRTPLTALNNAEIKLEGTTRVEDLINNLPQAFANAKVSFERTVPPVEASAEYVVTYAIER